MKNFYKRIYLFLSLLGFNPIKLMYLFRGIPGYFIDFIRFRRQMKLSHDFKIVKLFPVLDDKFTASGTMKGHYFHQDLLVARRIFENKPLKHIDIGSRTDGFVAHVASFREIEIFDIRLQESNVKNIVYRQADLMKLHDELTDYCDSVSSLHAIEHFGLGRYGDQIDSNGHIKGIENIFKILKSNGTFYFSVPIGKQRIEFNAHRVFSLEYILKILTNKFIIKSFSYVDDDGNLFENVNLSSESINSSFNCIYGCGIFELKKYLV
jgi:hypothetical protein